MGALDNNKNQKSQPIIKTEDKTQSVANQALT